MKNGARLIFRLDGFACEKSTWHSFSVAIR